MDLNHDQRAEAHSYLVPMILDGDTRQANATAQFYAGKDWAELIAEAKMIAG